MYLLCVKMAAVQQHTFISPYGTIPEHTVPHLRNYSPFIDKRFLHAMAYWIIQLPDMSTDFKLQLKRFCLKVYI